MRRFGFVIVLIVLLVIGCGLIVQKLREVTIEPPPPRTVPVHLPSKCQPFYNDGTGRWAECMGVGPI